MQHSVASVHAEKALADANVNESKSALTAETKVEYEVRRSTLCERPVAAALPASACRHSSARAKDTTAERAQVVPEGRALTGARSAGRAQNHVTGSAKPYFYGAGRILGRVSRLYGYSLLLSGISSLFLSGFSSLPLTKWDDKDKGGVPSAHVELVSVLLMLWSAAVNAFGCAFNISTADPFIDPDKPHYCQRYAWSATFAGNMIGCVLSACVFTGLPLALGANPKFFMLDVANLVVGFIGAVILADRMMWLQYVADVGNATAEQVEAASVRTSLRRMSHAILVLENEDGRGAAAVLPEEEENEESETSAGSTEANDEDTGHELGSEEKKEYSFANALSSLGNTLVLGLIMIGYPVAVLPYYRADSTTDWERFAVVCVLHPILQEFFLTVQRQVSGNAFKKLENDPDREYWALRSIIMASLLEEVMVMQRRMMLGAMRDPTASVLTIVVTGLEEALVRCTMVYRDELWDWITGKPEPTESEIQAKRLVQAASAAAGMRVEVTSIITSRIAYLLMRPHRFAFNFGYGFDANDDAMTSAAFLFASMFLELGLEVAIDCAALDIEQRHGINVDKFWEMWQVNPGNFFGFHVSCNLAALFCAFWAFSTLPTPFFCTSQHDPCSCVGGGFQIFKPLCDAASSSEEDIKNLQSNTSNSSGNGTSITTVPENTTLDFVKTSAKNEYVDIFESLGEGSTTIAVTVAVIIFISLIFTIARSKLFAAKVEAEAEREREEAEQRELELREQNKKIEEQNRRIQDQLMLTQLNAKQAAIVEANSSDLDKQVPAVFQIDWRDLLFEGRLGSGSFGDCYKGRTKSGGRPVAIKRMRSGLVDEKGFQAFRREVVMLSKVDHFNIVSFFGYSTDPFLLIVMDFVSGGTLRDLVEKHDPLDPPSMQILMKILIGSAKGFAYLHETEPMPILHRDIKSENILLTNDFEARIADLGEARVMAEDHAMTIVGTPGYTAPEVLRGEHYDTSADVFSFAIVMCELMTLRAPYSDLMRNDEGQSLLTWSQITALTQKKEGGLRPSLPDEMDDGMVRLVRESWSGDAALRPSFSVIVVRLEGIKRRGDRTSRSQALRILSAKVADEKNILSLCRGMHDLLYHYKPAEWSEKKAVAIVDEEVTVTAANPTLHEILSTEKGPACIKSLAWMMFSGLEDGAEIIIEPLLDEDVTIDLEKKSALVAINFGVKPPKKRHQWTGKDKREFDNLEQALAEAEKAMEAHGAEALHEAVSEKESGAKPKLKRKLKLKRKKKPNRFQGRWGRNKNKKKDDPFTIFVKAAKFVRGMGAGTIHPSAKLRLFGLLMQAQRGNIDQGEEFNLPGLKGSALALQKLKLRAWRSQKDKKREDAMKEYVELVTSLAPQWKVAHLLGSNNSVKDKKARVMMWVLKVKYREATEEERMKAPTATSAALMDFYRVTSIEVLQSSNATSARLWAEEHGAANSEKETATDSASGAMGGEGAEELDVDPFIANIPKDWSLSDCIVDKSKFKTMQEQRAHFQDRMREMARTGHDEEDGWKFHCKTKSPLFEESQQLDVWQRDVPWSSAKQMKSVAETEFSADDVFDHFINIFEGVQVAAKLAKAHAPSESLKTSHTSSAVEPFICVQQDIGTKLQYREIPLPWPLDDRDFIIVQEFVRIVGGTDGRNWFFSYNHDFEHPHFAQRPGFVRGSVKYQGMVGVPGNGGKTRLTWLVNFDFKGIIPPSFGYHFLIGAMGYPLGAIRALQEDKQQSRAHEGDVDARGNPGGDDHEAEFSLSRTSALLETIAELKAQREKDASIILELQTQGTRDELKISGLEEEVSTLRRRLAGRGAGTGTGEHREHFRE